MKLSELMNAELVEMELTAGSIEDILRQLVSRMSSAGFISNSDDALQRLVEREQVMSTGIGDGIAIPHARTPEVRSTVVAVGRSSQGVDFGAMDDKPVEVMFLILGPPDSSAEHVKVLARIARLVKQTAFHDAVVQAASPEQVVEAVRLHE